MPNAHLHELMVDELKDIYNAERQLLAGLKKLVSTAEGEELKNAFKEHLQETEGQIDKLKQVFQLLDLPARGKKCKAMEGLLNEADEIMSEFEGSEALDAALVAAAQKVEHYEIATYGSLATYAKLMQHDDVAAIFAEILEQEKNADEKLTQVAMSKANKK
ncbi:ferritin-like domain-containing protein [Sphingobacterium hotanense]|uniref:Ferritin-like domain-containing protein n=3 Tax=Sphingobacterium TaxID=28453 RepID=A0ABT7NN94_9SPHI|nr:ferritin-like domain-containing protein [Sphingobacterium hotanense]